MNIMGMDVATSTGIARIETGRPASEWRCLAVECEGENGEDKAGDLAVYLYGEILASRPAFVAIEMPQRSVAQFGRKKRDPLTGEERTEQTINPNALQLSALAGAVVAVLDICRVPWGLIAPVSWRSAYFGKGYKPAQDWKQSAIEMARLQKVPLPATVKAQRDAAEALGIAVAWQRCTFIPARHRAAFMDLRTGKVAA